MMSAAKRDYLASKKALSRRRRWAQRPLQLKIFYVGANHASSKRFLVQVSCDMFLCVNAAFGDTRQEAVSQAMMMWRQFLRKRVE